MPWPGHGLMKGVRLMVTWNEAPSGWNQWADAFVHVYITQKVEEFHERRNLQQAAAYERQASDEAKRIHTETSLGRRHLDREICVTKLIHEHRMIND
jgi:hypothetical protein